MTFCLFVKLNRKRPRLVAYINSYHDNTCVICQPKEFLKTLKKKPFGQKKMLMVITVHNVHND